jgi:hypothetical protein
MILVACNGLCDEKYKLYVMNNPAEFGGSIQPETLAKQLFNEKFSLGKDYLKQNMMNLLII